MKILFCSDGSSQAENAVRFGALIAAAYQTETTILGIVERASEQDAVLQALRRAQEILKEHHLNAELITKAGRPVAEIVKRTQETKYDLVVIGAIRKGTTGPRWMSARAYKIIEAVTPPVVVVIGERPALRRILLCTGGTRYADTTAQFAGEIARRVNATVTLWHVLAEIPAVYENLNRSAEEHAAELLQSNSTLGRSLRHQKELLENAGVPCEILLRHGQVLQELLAELQRADYDLVVSGSSPSRNKLRTYVMGNITREIVNRADLPVLVVRSETHSSSHGIGEFMSHLLKRPAAALEHPPKNAENRRFRSCQAIDSLACLEQAWQWIRILNRFSIRGRMIPTIASVWSHWPTGTKSCRCVCRWASSNTTSMAARTARVLMAPRACWTITWPSLMKRRNRARRLVSGSIPTSASSCSTKACCITIGTCICSSSRTGRGPFATRRAT
jgi:nucleotide-binding universal stress UspA family protein